MMTQAIKRSRFAALALCPLTLAACLDSAQPLEDDADEAQATAAVISIDTTDEPLPSPQEVVQLASVFSVAPGVRVCYPELSAANSAGIGGQFQFSNFVKYPKVSVFYRSSLSGTQSKFFAGPVIPDSTGYFQQVFNKSNGYAGLFPGLFQFCLRNSALNPGPFFSNATVVTF